MMGINKVIRNRGMNDMPKNLTVEQKNILSSMKVGAAFAADVAHACITMYVWDDNPKFLYIYHQELPRTQFFGELPDKTGRELRGNEEPLVQRALQRGVPLSGKRELSLGLFVDLRVYPIQDSKGKCFAVVAFDTNEPEELFIMTAVEFLKNTGRQILSSNYYGRLLPGDGLMIVDKDKVIIAANRTARHLFKVQGLSNLVGRRTNSLQINWPLVGMVLKTGVAEGKEIDMQGLLLAMRVIPVTNRPDTAAAIVILQDITELKKKDTELLIKSVVIREIHHRVKNNLQTIASLLRLQARRAHTDETKMVLRDCINRVTSIAVVHEFLSQQDSGKIDVAVAAQGIYEAIIASMADPNLKLQTSCKADNVLLPSDKATSIALVLNELLQNSLDHAFAGRSSGRLDVEFYKIPGSYCLKICDDGNGLPPGFVLDEQTSLGLKIIKTMVEADLRGTFTIEALKQGTCAVVTIPSELEGSE